MSGVHDFVSFTVFGQEGNISSIYFQVLKFLFCYSYLCSALLCFPLKAGPDNSTGYRLIYIMGRYWDYCCRDVNKVRSFGQMSCHCLVNPTASCNRGENPEDHDQSWYGHQNYILIIIHISNIRAHVDIFHEMRTNDQSDHDIYSRIFYHCWPASKRILRSSPHCFLPQGVLDLLGLLISFFFVLYFILFFFLLGLLRLKIFF